MNKETSKEHKYWISVLEEDDRNLTDWEKGFLENITIQLNWNTPLTDSQESVLERIYQRKGGR